MYCYKCGQKNKNTNVSCKSCHKGLLPLDENNLVSKDAILEYKERVKLSKGYVPDLEEVNKYYSTCLLYVEKRYKKNIKRIKDLYLPKIEIVKDDVIEKERLTSLMNNALNEETKNYEKTLKSIKDENKASIAMVHLQRFSEEANMRIPLVKEKEKSHEFAQYIHKRIERDNDRIQSSLSFVIIGTILLIIGFIFLSLSFKIKTGQANVRELKFDSLEFIIFIIGVGVGFIFLVIELTIILKNIKEKKKLENALNYLRIYHQIG